MEGGNWVAVVSVVATMGAAVYGHYSNVQIEKAKSQYNIQVKELEFKQKNKLARCEKIEQKIQHFTAELLKYGKLSEEDQKSKLGEVNLLAYSTMYLFTEEEKDIVRQLKADYPDEEVMSVHLAAFTAAYGHCIVSQTEVIA